MRNAQFFNVFGVNQRKTGYLVNFVKFGCEGNFGIHDFDLRLSLNHTNIRNMDLSKESIETIAENINSVKDVLECLSELDKDQFNSCINAVDLSSCDFEPYGTWSKESYTRNCLYCDDRYEAILLCWEPGQRTPIHDHGGEECWVKIVDGVLKETIYKPDDSNSPVEVSTNIARTGATSYMVDFMGCHRLENNTNNRAMSLHIYAKPIAQCNIYDEQNAQYKAKVLEYDCVFDV